ncbi:hypothetical protein GCM10011416_04310 [Polaribacter pacificus]|uniref:CBS domain-containing protein n=1 Tax=Polaribacter pacificus TaxID=1775173 RepID=A0A917HWK2_9FLAO|nr:CBS domain-containing protein [Polaribacter pacificus]GGG90920.1 hypothetical protein GCM10011416_04310 [Polaribacter pacificus]
MNISEYILKDFKPLTLQCTVEQAQHLCEDLPITHIPIVEQDRLIGCFAQSDIQSIENRKQTLSEVRDLFYYFAIDSSASILELLKIFADNDANIIPVLEEQTYQGYYELSDILDVFASSPFLATDGFDLVVQKNNKELMMSEISQIVEANNALLLGCFISKKDVDNTQVTMKISSQEINEIIQTFRRYNYTVVTKHKDDSYLEELKNRADYLQKYLNT